RYVIPEINGFLDGYRDSRAFVIENREWFDRAGQAVMSKIMSHEGAAAALKAGMEAGVAMRSPNAPDLNQAAKGLK
ncbi:MAG: flavin-dependent oxidoreductase, partial [Phenylobacterium sp.]|nr:flavin-dependent oxidoreductase [Phenylobacterium sp.]